MTKLTKYEINEPAYPVKRSSDCYGLSKLEALASEQCAALISNPHFNAMTSHETVAALAVEVAKVILLKCKEETR